MLNSNKLGPEYQIIANYVIRLDSSKARGIYGLYEIMIIRAVVVVPA